MNRDRIFPGVRALSVVTIGRLEADSVVKVIVVDRKKITIEAIVDAVKRKYFLSPEEFRRDFNPMEFFAGVEIAEPSDLTKPDIEKETVQSPKPHAKDYLYTAAL